MTTSYTAGTVSVTAGSDIVTGVGTGWQSANISPGYFGLDSSNGNPIPVAEIISDTQMRLVKPWRGTNASGQGYWLSYDTRDGQQTVNNAQRLAEYVAMLNKPSLAALGALTPAANTFPWFPTPTTAEAANITAFGRNWVAALNSSAAYGVLGEVPNAQLPARLRENSPVVTDADAVLSSGSYSVLGTAANIPEALPGMLVVDAYSTTTAAIQYYVRASGTVPNIWYRVRAGGAWGAWVRIPNFGSDNIIPDGSLPSRLKETIPVITDDLDIDRPTGFYSANSPTLNRPLGTNSFVLHMRHTANFQVQIAVHHVTSRTFVRNKISGTWQAWTRIDGDLSGPGAAVTNNSFVGFDGTTGYLTKALTVLEALGNLGPVLGGAAPDPSGAGVGMVDGDFNTVIFPGVYTIAGNWNNGPLAPALTHTGVLEVQARRYNNLYVQILRLQDRRVFKRVSTSATGPWDAWGITEGDVSGPATSVDNAPVSFSGTTGKVIKPVTGAIAALHALTPAANQLPYFTSGTAAANTTLSAFARTVIDDANGAAMFATMGASVSGNANAWTAVFPNGFKVQGGVSSHSITTADSAISFTWPSAFTTGWFSAIVQANNHTSNVVCGVEGVTLTGASGYAKHLAAANTVQFKWIGFGF